MKCNNCKTEQPCKCIVNTPMHEHDTVKSKTTGRDIEISMGMSGSRVPKNPFASLAQAGYMHTHPEILGKGLDEWDAATKGKHLPHHVKK